MLKSRTIARLIGVVLLTVLLLMGPPADRTTTAAEVLAALDRDACCAGRCADTPHPPIICAGQAPTDSGPCDGAPNPDGSDTISDTIRTLNITWGRNRAPRDDDCDNWRGASRSGN